MNTLNYLEKYQPLVYQTFLHALKRHNVSHAYLLKGEFGSPLLEVATFFGQTLLCENPTPWACEKCLNCLRIAENNYLDFLVFDGRKETIKRGEISNLSEQFEMSAYEKTGIKVYVIHLVENMTLEAINAILKFLEEPKENVYAFLTTWDFNNVLETIVSRCQLLSFLPIDRKEIITDTIALGVKKGDAEVLSYLYHDPHYIESFVADKDQYIAYHDLKEKIISLLCAIGERKKAIFIMESEIIPWLKSKEVMNQVIDILSLFYLEALNMKNGLTPCIESYDTILEGLIKSGTDLDSSLISLLKAKVSLKSNLNPSLLADHLINEMTK